MIPAADGHLGDVGHQVIGDTSGILANYAGSVGADGVEVAQQFDAPFRIGMSHTTEDLLGHILGPAVGVGAVSGFGRLTQRHFIVAGVDGGRGGDDDVLHTHLIHYLRQHQGGVQVIVVVFPGYGDGFAHGLQTGKVDAAANLIFGKDFAQQCLIPNIALVEFDRFAGQFLNALQTLRIGVAQIIDDDNTIVAIQQLDAGMGTNIAGTAGNKNIHDYLPSKKPIQHTCGQ